MSMSAPTPTPTHHARRWRTAAIVITVFRWLGRMRNSAALCAAGGTLAWQAYRAEFWPVIAIGAALLIAGLVGLRRVPPLLGADGALAQIPDEHAFEQEIAKRRGTGRIASLRQRDIQGPQRHRGSPKAGAVAGAFFVAVGGWVLYQGDPKGLLAALLLLGMGGLVLVLSLREIRRESEPLQRLGPGEVPR